MYMTVSGEKDANALQQDLDSLAEWESKWQMKFHPEKCSVLRISRSTSPIIHNYELHGHILKNETDSKYLGVKINNKLSWNNHIDKTCSKANSSLAFLRRNLQISQTHIKAAAYTTPVRPQLEYAASIWDPYTSGKQNQLEMVQRRAARFAVKNYERKASVTKMLETLQWRSLLERRADLRLVMFYKCIHGLVAVDITSGLQRQTRPSRHSHPMSYHLPVETKLYLQKSFLPRTITQWNSLPASIVMSESLDTFRTGISGLTH